VIVSVSSMGMLTHRSFMSLSVCGVFNIVVVGECKVCVKYSCYNI